MIATRCVLAMSLIVAGCGANKSAPPAKHDADAAVDSEGSSGGEEDEFEFEDVGEDAPDGKAAKLTPEQESVVADVTAATDKLDADKLALDQAKAAMDAADAELAERFKSIEQLEKRLDELLGQGEQARARRTQRIGVLAGLILTMKPQAAAQMVAQMSDADAQAILLAMSAQDARKAAKLLAALPGQRAAEISQLYLDDDPKVLAAGVGGGGTEAPPSEVPAATGPTDEVKPSEVDG